MTHDLASGGRLYGEVMRFSNQFFSHLQYSSLPFFDLGIFSTKFLEILPTGEGGTPSYNRDQENIIGKVEGYTAQYPVAKATIQAEAMAYIYGGETNLPFLRSRNSVNNPAGDRVALNLNLKTRQSQLYFNNWVLNTISESVIAVNTGILDIFFKTWTQNQNFSSNTSTHTSVTGVDDGVVDYTVTTDMTTESEANALALHRELKKEVSKMQAGGDLGATNAITYLHVPREIVDYLGGYLKNYKLTYSAPAGIPMRDRPVTATGSTNTPTDFFFYDNIAYIGYPEYILGATDDDLSIYGYAQHAHGIKAYFTSNNGLNDAMSADRQFAQFMFDGASTPMEAITRELTMNRDPLSIRFLEDAKRGTVFQSESVAMQIPDNIYRLKVQDGNLIKSDSVLVEVDANAIFLRTSGKSEKTNRNPRLFRLLFPRATFIG